MSNYIASIRLLRVSRFNKSCASPICVNRGFFTGNLDNNTSINHERLSIPRNKINYTYNGNHKFTANQTRLSKKAEEEKLSLELKKRNLRLINAADMMKMIEKKVPTLLVESFPAEKLSKHIILRICPHTLTFLPIFKHQYSYFTVLQTLRLVITNFIVNPKVKLHISSIHMEEPAVQIDETDIEENVQESLEKELIDRIPMFSESAPGSHKYSLFPWTRKIIVKWRTCAEGCNHLQDKTIRKNIENSMEFSRYQTSEAKLGKFKLSQLNEINLSSMKFSALNSSMGEILSKVPDHEKANGKSHESERVLSGIFIFELNLLNDKVLVHNIEDIEIIERKIEVPDLNNLVGAT